MSMKKIILSLLLCCWFAGSAKAALTVREIHYTGRLADDEARFTLDVDAEATGSGASSLPFLAGDVALLPGKLPGALSLSRVADGYRLTATQPGRYQFKVEIAARIQREEPWNRVTFTGPAAPIAAVIAQAAGDGMEIQMLTGTLLAAKPTNGLAQVSGFLGADQTLALRWQGKVAAVAHKAMLTVDSDIAAQLSPAVVKYTSRFRYQTIQGAATQLTLALPLQQTITRLEGAQIRDWHTVTEGSQLQLIIEFIKPVDTGYELKLYSEQTTVQPVDHLTAGETITLNPPQPLEVERETGTLTLTAEDTLVEVASVAGLRQVNATDQAVAAYQFNTRPFTLALQLKPVEPVVSTVDRISARLEETRLLTAHQLDVTVEKAGIYALELTPPAGDAVADVQGDGVEDWKVSAGKLRVNFSARVLGARRLTVQLEEALKSFPEQIRLAPVRVTGAVKESAQIGVAALAGIRVKTGDLAGLREIPVANLPDRRDETLAYTTTQPDWSLSIGTARLDARVVADVFNLVTIGDGSVGGSATIRYSLANQGVQEFQVRVPAHCRNVDFTGPNIRRKEQSGEVWTIGLQDKAWGGYTLVVTYDYPFDPQGAELPVGGIHPQAVERETGSIAVTTAASLQLNVKTAGETLHRVDETELSAADRAMAARAVTLAWQYAGGDYALTLEAKRFAELRVLDAVADRTQITSVLTANGEMLTQASFMVKNNEKQFQRFQLPASAKLWSCAVNGQPVKPERDGDWVLVSLPRDLNRDQAFAVDIIYAQTNGMVAAAKWSHPLELAAPRTDVPNTYAEWQVFVPPTLRLSDFGGSMKVTEGTTYDWLDAWQKFLTFYGEVLREAGGAILLIGLIAVLVISLVISAVRYGWNGVATLLVVMMMLGIVGAMLLPALASAKRKAQRINSVNNLKEIGLAMKIFAGDNTNRLPGSFEEMRDQLGTDKITYDTETGERYVYLGAGLDQDALNSQSVVAYSPIFKGHCNVLYADGSVAQISDAKFAELSQRGFLLAANGTSTVSANSAAPMVAEAYNGIDRAGVLADKHGVAFGGTLSINAGALGLAGATDEPTGPPPVVAGIRSLHIELPQTGQPFLFTKVLNIQDEPLSIRAQAMPLMTYQLIQMAWQSGLFVLGAIGWWWHWRRSPRSSFKLALALALMTGSTASLLVQWHALHDALIVGFPVVALAVIALLVWRYWPRRAAAEAVVEPTTFAPTEAPAGPTIPPVVAAVVLALMICGSSAQAATAPEAALTSANYTGVINDRVAVLDAAYEFSGVTNGYVFPLFTEDVAVQEFTAKNGNATLIRNGNGLSVRFNRNGTATVQAKLLVKVTGDVTRRRLDFLIPPALTSQAVLTLEQPGADVDFPAAISCRRTLVKDQTRVTALLGSTDRMELLWTPRVKRVDEVAATVFCQNSALVTLGGGAVNLRATLDYSVTQGELREARVQLPAGQRLLRVEGDQIRNWELKTDNGVPVLVVTLSKGVSPAWRLVVETESALAALPASATVALPHALDVKRETGLIGLAGSEGLALTVEDAASLQRVDVGEFARNSSSPDDNLVTAYRFSQPEFSLRVHAETIQPQIAAVVLNRFQVTPTGLTLAATVDYDIKRAGVFGLRLLLPAGFRLDPVKGDNILQSSEQPAAGGRTLDITLKERTIGHYRLGITLVRDFKTLPASLALAGVHPAGAAKLTGYVTVAAEPGVAVKTATFDGLSEIPAMSLPGEPAANGDLAFKFISADPAVAADWNLTVSTTAVAAWVRVEIFNAYTLAETLVTGRAQVRYDIANAPVRELRVHVPGQFRNVEITGPNIRSREQIGNDWRIELQSPMSGGYLLNVTWDQPRTNAGTALELAGISAVNVERETGWLAVSAPPSLQVGEQAAPEFQRMDTGDYPDWAGHADASLALLYRYVRPGGKLTLEVRRFDAAAVLEALVDSAQLTSVVADDGQMMTELSLNVRNNGRQFLSLELPAGAQVWSAFVAGQPVRPCWREGRLLLPIESTGADDGALTVQLTYAGTNQFPQVRGAVDFASPKFDVPLKNAHWDIYLPADYEYRNFAGTMTHELSALAEAAASFSRLDYSRMEQVTKFSAQAEVQKDVSAARQLLAGGNVREATANYYRAKTKFGGGRMEDSGVQDLEKQLRRAQASNLVSAQNDFSLRNRADAVDGANRNQPASMDYDTAAATLQWQKLQQAQEIVTTRVQPLHVNLPLRGVRVGFAQVLQTEGGHAMTVQLQAENRKAVNWPSRGLKIAAAFAALWALAAWVSRLKPAVRR